jgi:hypothetical protein
MRWRPEDFGLTEDLVQEIEAAETERNRPAVQLMTLGLGGCVVIGFLVGFAYTGLFGVISGLLLSAMFVGLAFLPLGALGALITAARPKHPRLADYERYRIASGRNVIVGGGRAEPKGWSYSDHDADGGP